MSELINHQGITCEGVPILAIFNRIENVTTCTIVLSQDSPRRRLTASGVAVLNPADEQDNQIYANRLAFRRAAVQMEEDRLWFEIPEICAKRLYRWYRQLTREDKP